MLVVLNLLVGIFVIGFGTSGRFQLEENERQSVHEYDNVGTLIRSPLNEGPLIYDMKIVAIGIIEVDETNDIVAVFLAVEPANFHAALQHVREGFVLSNEGPALDFLDFCDSEV